MIACALGVFAASATATIPAPVTVDGPSAEIIDFGGVAMASDGSGGLVYTKTVEGVPHVFASRYVDGEWSGPIRVDWNQRFEAAQARIAAVKGGELIVVWVAPIWTIEGKIRRALYSATLGSGSRNFGQPLLVDPNVGEGKGVEPSLAASAPGNAIVAYRVITEEFAAGSTPISGAVQLRPGDVMADVRVARLSGGRWSRLGAINRNPAASMRPPGPGNAPQIGIGATGNAVVAWQEPDSSGAARIWLRRIFGTTLGPPWQVSPSTWEGMQVTEDAESFSLAVTPFDRAQIVVHLAASSAGAGRTFISALGPSSAAGSGQPEAPQLVSGAAGPLGPGSVAAADAGGGKGRVALASTAGPALRAYRAEEKGGLTALALSEMPAVQEGGVAMATVDPSGGGLFAYPTVGSSGPVVAVRQESPSGAVQTALLSGSQTGPVNELAVAPSGSGDGLIGFRQGEPGHFEIVGARVSAPPAPFDVKGPSGWVLPKQARLNWQQAAGSSGNITYTVLVGGRAVSPSLNRLHFQPRPAELGTGVLSVRVLATDSLGGQVLSKPVKLRVDGQPPVARVTGRAGGHRVTLKVGDADSGLRTGATKVSFGDGSSRHGGSRFHHLYPDAGTYTITVHARDRVGNRLAQSFKVHVK